MPEATRIVGDKDVIAGYNSSTTVPIPTKRIVLGTGAGEDEVTIASAASQAFLGVTNQAIAPVSRGDVQKGGKGIVTSGAAVTKGVRVTADGDGKAIAATAGDAVLGTAATTVGAADLDLEVWLGEMSARMPG